MAHAIGLTMLFGSKFQQRRLTVNGINLNLVHGGKGLPLLLLHGYPQTHVIWHQVAPRLAQHFHVICPDLRGYGDSDKPPSAQDHAPYSKRVMANDMLQLMQQLGYSQFAVAGHDRGGRVTHRLCLDAPQAVTRACVMDIVPTSHMFQNTDQSFATRYYHWFFLIQPDGLPERMIGADPEYYLREKLKRWGARDASFDEDAVAEYLRCFADPATVHATCEDYRAAASIDLQHDAADRENRIECPLLVLWGAEGFVQQRYDVLTVWQGFANEVSGRAIDRCGHFVPEEAPVETTDELLQFFLKTG